MRTLAFATASLLILAFTGCSSFIDEMKIRSDKNTIVNPDIWEMQDLEAREGYMGPADGDSMVSGDLPPLPETRGQGLSGSSDDGLTESQRRAASAQRQADYVRQAREQAGAQAPRQQRPEKPLPDTAKEMGIVPFNGVPGMQGNQPSYSPDLLDELRQ